MSISIGGFRDFPPGNIKGKKDDGNTRAPVENEPDPLVAKGLSEPEILLVEKNKIYNKKELTFLTDLLASTEFFEKKWKAGEALENPKIREAIVQKLPPRFRYAKLIEHLETLAAQGK
jgi:hypothetical protein